VIKLEERGLERVMWQVGVAGGVVERKEKLEKKKITYLHLR